MDSSLSTLLNFEGHDLAFLRHQTKGELLRSTDLCGPMGKDGSPLTRQAIAYKVAQLDPEDRVQVKLATLGGYQTVDFLTPSGSLQVMATGRSKKCARLRKVVCDFYVKNSGRDDLVSELLRVQREQQAEIDALKAAHRRLTGHIDHGPHNAEVRRSLKQRKYYKSAAYLLFRNGFKASRGEANSFTARCKAYSIEHGLKHLIERCGRAGGHVYFQRKLLDLVYGELPSGQLALEAAERFLESGDE